MPAKKFTKNCHAYKVMESLFDEGTITADTVASDLYKRGKYVDVFAEFSDSVVRTHFNKMKAEKGVLVRNDAGKTTVAQGIAAARAAAATNAAVLGETAALANAKSTAVLLDVDDDLKPPPVASAANSFVTPVTKTEEDDDGDEIILPSICTTVEDSQSMRKKQVLVVHMPSGITKKSQWKSDVVGNGGYYRCNIQQHSTMGEPMVLASAIPSSVDPAFHFFAKDAINAELREMCGGKRKELVYTFKKKLEFKCETKILVEQPATYNGCSFLLLVLQAVEEDSWNLTNEANDMVDLNEKLAKLKEKGF